MNAQRTVILMIAFSLVGCTTLRPLPGAPADIAAELKVDEVITVHETSGKYLEMHYQGVSNNELHGILTANAAPVSVPFADIDRIEAERVDGLRTTLFVAGTAATLSLLVAAIEAAGAAAILGATP